MTYELVLLDLDQTLFDFDQSEDHAFDHAMRAAGYPDPAALFHIYARINSEMWRAVERGELTPAQTGALRFVALADETGADFDAHVATREFIRGLGLHGEMLPGALSLLDELATKTRLAMVTNGLTEVQRTKIARLDLEKWFEAIVISDEVGIAKPDPAIFDLALTACDFTDRSRVLMVGDSLASDIAGGAGAGIDTCWFNPTRKPRPDRGPIPTHEIAALNGLANLL